MKKYFAVTLVAVFFAAPFAFAASDPSDEDHVFRVNFSQAEVNFDPHRSQTALEAQLYTALYEGLTAYDPLSLRPNPGSASKYEFSADGKTVTFTLRDQLKYSDGTNVTNKDFVESWFALIDPSDPGPYASLLDEVVGVQEYREGRLKDRSKVGFRADGKNQLVLQLVEPAPQILSILAHYAFVPVHPIVREKGLTGLPIGNGPFVLKSATKSEWLLVRNELYWDKANVKLPQIRVTFRDDDERVTREFKDGVYDWLASGIDASKPLSQRVLSVAPLFATSFFYLNVKKAPWNDERVRRALIMALPLEEIRKGNLQPTSVLIPAFQGYPSPQGLESDREQALKLLAEAGFPKGKGLPALTVALPAGEGNLKLADELRDGWKDLGIEVKVAPVDGNYYDRLSETEHDIAFFSWIGDFLDPTTFLGLWKSTSSLNTFGFGQKEYDQILADASKQSGDERLKTLAKAEKYLLQKGLLIPLSHSIGVNLIDRDLVGGWYPNPLDLHPFKNLYLKPGRAPKNVVLFDLPAGL